MKNTCLNVSPWHLFIFCRVSLHHIERGAQKKHNRLQPQVRYKDWLNNCCETRISHGFHILLRTARWTTSYLEMTAKSRLESSGRSSSPEAAKQLQLHAASGNALIFWCGSGIDKGYHEANFLDDFLVLLFLVGQQPLGVKKKERGSAYIRYWTFGQHVAEGLIHCKWTLDVLRLCPLVQTSHSSLSKKKNKMHIRPQKCEALFDLPHVWKQTKQGCLKARGKHLVGSVVTNLGRGFRPLCDITNGEESDEAKYESGNFLIYGSVLTEKSSGTFDCLWPLLSNKVFGFQNKRCDCYL